MAEGLPTVRTHIRPLACVYAKVHLQVGCIAERFPTLVASERLLLCVDFLVHLQVGCPCEWFQTVRTFRRCFSSVRSWARAQLGFWKEGLPTSVTGKRCPSSVSHLLRARSWPSREVLPTFGIFNWLVLRKNFTLPKWLLRAENLSYQCCLFSVRSCTGSMRRAPCEEPTASNNAIGLPGHTAFMSPMCLKVGARLQRFFR